MYVVTNYVQAAFGHNLPLPLNHASIRHDEKRASEIYDNFYGTYHQSCFFVGQCAKNSTCPFSIRFPHGTEMRTYSHTINITVRNAVA